MREVSFSHASPSRSRGEQADAEPSDSVQGLTRRWQIGPGAIALPISVFALSYLAFVSRKNRLPGDGPPWNLNTHYVPPVPAVLPESGPLGYDLPPPTVGTATAAMSDREAIARMRQSFDQCLAELPSKNSSSKHLRRLMHVRSPSSGESNGPHTSQDFSVVVEPNQFPGSSPSKAIARLVNSESSSFLGGRSTCRVFLSLTFALSTFLGVWALTAGLTGQGTKNSQDVGTICGAFTILCSVLALLGVNYEFFFKDSVRERTSQNTSDVQYLPQRNTVRQHQLDQ
eukprot:GHVT01024793.1.p1 GENE.GHVT01024793.1~~GHVT01024793.1.p1  ORF type:complete len:285 (-),score=17.36 GHVT01024793.1:649-1503(-)